MGAGFRSSPMTAAPCYAERAVDALLIKSPGNYTEALHFLAICRTFSSGGTRIRTGDTMIFRSVPKPAVIRHRAPWAESKRFLEVTDLHEPPRSCGGIVVG